VNKTRLFSITLIALLWIAFAAYVWFTAPQLPERVATHFGGRGQPNGWMTREQHVRFTLIMGTAMPAFVLGVFAFMRRGSGRGLNIPHKDYWLAPERRDATFDFLQNCGRWLAGLLIAFLAGVHYSILAANARSPVALSLADLGSVAGFFLAALAVWVVLLHQRFRIPV
jgi:hypothetical protein